MKLSALSLWMNLSGCLFLAARVLWEVINSWPPLTPLCHQGWRGSTLAHCKVRRYNKANRAPWVKLLQESRQYTAMSQRRIRTKNVIHGTFSNIRVGMCWTVSLSGYVAACEGDLHECELMPREPMWLTDLQPQNHERYTQRQTQPIVNKTHQCPWQLFTEIRQSWDETGSLNCWRTKPEFPSYEDEKITLLQLRVVTWTQLNWKSLGMWTQLLLWIYLPSRSLLHWASPYKHPAHSSKSTVSSFPFLPALFYVSPVSSSSLNFFFNLNFIFY